MLTDFTIKNFRGIKELTLPSLKRVNLFVGKNGVGKTSILEAVELWAGQLAPQVMIASLQRRGEAGLSGTQTPVEAIFGGEFKSQPVTRKQGDVETLVARFPAKVLGVGPAANFQIAQIGEDQVLAGPAGIFRLYESGWPTVAPFVKSLFVPSSGLDDTSLDQLWSSLYLERVDQLVLKSLRMMRPEIEDVSFGDLGRRVPLVGLAGQPKRVPLARLGDGAMRLIGLTLALVAARNGILLIDEFENGLHYSIQTEIWRFVLQASEELNVQVFATTHSRDTLYALAEASDTDDHVAYRLEVFRGKLQAIEFLKDDLDVVREAALEVR